ncbi:hypothetical protein, partial [Falsibacillus albus]|uniref:hypothetical protein n=1 Tax=Falsibacillus albus TaxID=2478915 RepID=UPI001F3ED3C4
MGRFGCFDTVAAVTLRKRAIFGYFCYFYGGDSPGTGAIPILVPLNPLSLHDGHLISILVPLNPIFLHDGHL